MKRGLFLIFFVIPSLVFSNQAFKAVIFDCDGTLVDSEPFQYSAWRKAIQNWGGDITHEEWLTFVGTPSAKIALTLAEKYGCSDVGSLLTKKEHYLLDSLAQGFPPIVGTVQWARLLIQEKERLGLKLALASAAPRVEILAHLKSLGLEEAFDLILSGHEDLSEYFDPEGLNKPKPYIYLHAAKLLGVSPSECLVIEDSATGIMASSRAGCITLAVPNAYTRHQDLSQAHFQMETLLDESIESVLDRASSYVQNSH